MNTLVFLNNYYIIRELLYYTYNSNESIKWSFKNNRVKIRFFNERLKVFELLSTSEEFTISDMAPHWGKLGQRFSYSKMLMIGLLGGGIGNLLELATHNLIGFGILRFSYGLFFAAVYPALNAFHNTVKGLAAVYTIIFCKAFT